MKYSGMPAAMWMIFKNLLEIILYPILDIQRIVQT